MLLKSILMNKTGQKTTKKQSKNQVNFQLINPNAAGIDIGDTLHAVAVPEGRDEVCVKEFGTFTVDLMAIADWLKACRIETVAMESTGVYWKNLFAVLISKGFEVYLVNARHTRSITGKKTDESDAQWIQKLHSCNLLKSSFLPDELTESLRTLVRYRRKLTQDSSTCVLRMQKALEMMNLKIHTVINDLMGKTGTAIVEAILAGERNAENFRPFVDCRIKADDSDIIKSLEGNWRREHLFLLEQHYKNYQFIQQLMVTCDKEIEQVLQIIHAKENDGISDPEKQIRLTPKGKVSKQKKDKNHPPFDTRAYLKGIHKVDVIDIYGINEISALEILAETGTDMSKWETPEHFKSWLNLCPNSKITGGKLISSKLLKKKPNAAAKAFRMAAGGVQNMDNWLGHFFRRMKIKGGHKYAIVATAAKLAVIYHQMLTHKQPFNPLNYEVQLEKYKQAKIASLQKTIDKLKKQVA
jgi:transposase